MAKLDLVELRNWRDQLRRTERSDEDAAEQDFAARAAEVRAEVEFLLKNGLNEGAEAALGTYAEEDMANFCIMVDLAQGLPVAGVEPLDDETALHLSEFLDKDPWHSLEVDIDITVAIAMVEDVAAQPERSWYDICPNLLGVTSRVLNEANREQLMRFAGELDAIQNRTGIEIPADVVEHLNFVIRQAAAHLGVAPPLIGAAAP